MRKSFIIFGISLGVIAGASVGTIIAKNGLLNPEYQADYPVYNSQAAMENKANLIIEGKILSSEVKKINIAQITNSNDPKINPSIDGKKSTEGNETEYTVSKVKVSEVYKGQNVNLGDIIEIKELGGAGSKSENKKLNKETDYLLFLESYPNGIPSSLLNPAQGSYKKHAGQYDEDSENKVKIDINALKKLKDK